MAQYITDVPLSGHVVKSWRFAQVGGMCVTHYIIKLCALLTNTTAL